MKNNAFILTLAYPETIVLHAEEWYSPLLPYLGIGGKKHVRAGHAALVLVHCESGRLEYHDFGRYITSEPNGRVRGPQTDFELDFPITAKIENNTITNLNEILQFLATQPKLTHGDGPLFASICKAVNYKLARVHIDKMQDIGFIRYAAFIKNACNCARFVTDTLIASLTDSSIRQKLKRSKWFTPSTVGNVLIADTEDCIYHLTRTGNFQEFKTSVFQLNKTYFLDRLKDYKPNLKGTLQPKYNSEIKNHAQWLGGIAAGAWFELSKSNHTDFYRFRRISPYGHIDCDGMYKTKTGFNLDKPYSFVHYSNCKSFHVEQMGIRYKFDYVRDYDLN